MLTVTLDRPSDQPASVGYRSADGTAAAPGDYAALAGTLTFAPQQTEQTITLTITDDALDEEDLERLTVELHDPVNARLGPAWAEVAIEDNDDAPRASLTATAFTAAEGAGELAITVQLSGPSARPLAVGHYVAGATAGEGEDFYSPEGAVVFAPGATSATFTVSITQDASDEDDETAIVQLVGRTAPLAGPDRATLTLVDDDAPPVVSISTGDHPYRLENQGPFALSVTLSEASGKTVTVNYLTQDGTAAAGADYTPASGVITFAPGETYQTLTVTLTDDAVAEASEDFAVRLSAPGNAALSSTEWQATATVVDDDTALPTVLFGQPANGAREGEGALIPVLLSRPSAQTVTVEVSLAGGTAESGEDYSSVTSLTFAPGATALMLPVTVPDDEVYEGSETVGLALHNPVNATTHGWPATVTVEDNEGVPLVMFSSDSYPAPEATGAGMVVVYLSHAAEETVTVDYWTADGTAVEPGDYAATAGTLTFAPGATVMSFMVPVVNDAIAEPEEKLDVFLGGVTGPAVLADGEATVTILDNDSGMLLVQFEAPTYSVDEPTKDAVAQVVLSAASPTTVTVTFSTGGGTASAGDDYQPVSGTTVTFAPSQTRQAVTVMVDDDELDEDDETVTLMLSNPVGAMLGPTPNATLTILDDEDEPTVFFDAELFEADEDQGTVTIYASLSEPSGRAVSVSYATSDGSATAPGDYISTSGVLVFAPGETSASFVVTIEDDEGPEADENAWMQLSNPVNATLGEPNPAELVIDDDDRGPLAISNTDARAWAFGATEGMATGSVRVATFTDAYYSGEPEPPSGYTAEVNWGDETVPQEATVLWADGQFEVRAEHTYERAGQYAVTITITRTYGDEESGGSVSSETVVYATARVVSDGSLTGEAAEGLSGVVCEPLSWLTVATFEDGDAWAAAGDYTAAIDWGDGGAEFGLVFEVSQGAFEVVVPEYTYRRAGHYLAVVHVKDEDGEELFLQVPVAVTPSAPGPGVELVGVPLEGVVEGQAWSGDVGTFVDSTPGVGPEHYTASINWGDGESSPALILPGPGNFVIHAAEGHVYKQPGVYTVTMTLTGPGGTQRHRTTAAVADAALTAQARELRLPAGYDLQDIQIVEALAPHGLDLGGDYEAWIDWGDGSGGWRGRVVGSGGPLRVAGSHKYEGGPGWYTIEVTLREAGAAAQVFTTAVQVVELAELDPMEPRVLAFVKTDEGTESNELDVRLDWGDEDPPPPFEERGSLWVRRATPTWHEAYYHDLEGDGYYLEPGDYTQSVEARYEDGTSAVVAPRQVRIADAPLKAAGDGPVILDGEAGETVGSEALFAFVDLRNERLETPEEAAFTIWVNWGNGSQEEIAPAAVTFADGVYTVAAGHSYAAAGRYDISIFVESQAFAGGEAGYNATLVGTAVAMIEPGEPAWELTAYQRRDDVQRAEWRSAGQAQVSLNTGALRLEQELDFDLSPGTEVGGSPALVYHSGTVEARPIIEALLPTAAGGPAVSLVTAQLTFDGVAGNPVLFTPAQLGIGETLQLAVQAGPVGATGVYPWSLDVTVLLADNTVIETTATGLAEVVVRDASPFGAGWWLSGLHQVVDNGDGALLVYGTGESRYFTRLADGTLVGPAEEMGTLVETCGGYVYTSKHGERWNFDGGGYLMSVEDRHGLGQTFEYSAGRLASVTSIDGGVTMFSYVPNVVVINQPGNRLISLELGSGRLSAIALDDSTRSFDYSGTALTSEAWASNQTADVIDQTYGYHADRTVGSVALGDETTPSVWQVNAAARRGLAPIGAIVGVSSGAAWTDPGLNATYAELDELGRALAVYNPGGGSNRYVRDDAGQVVVHTDPLGRTTYYYYAYGAGRGDLMLIFHPDWAIEGFAYDPVYHQLTAHLDELGRLEQNLYNATGDRVAHVDGMGNTTRWVYSAVPGQQGLATQVIDARGSATTFGYDGRRRLTSTRDALSNETAFFYDANGNLQRRYDVALMRSTTEQYDARNRLRERKDAANKTWTWHYNMLGQVTLATDPLLVQTRTEYDHRGWKTKTVEAVGTVVQRTTTFDHDAAGNLVYVGRRQKYDPPGQTAPLSMITAYGYDAMNRRTSQVDQAGALSRALGWQYDVAGQLTKETRPRPYDGTGATGPVETRYEYDLRGRQTLTVEASNFAEALQRQTWTVYDSAGQVRRVIDPAVVATDYEYDAAGRRTLVTEAAGTAVERRRRSLYDAVGNLTHEVSPLGVRTAYSYDEMNRLRWTYEAWGDARYQRSTERRYDAAGNLIALVEPRAYDFTGGLPGEPARVTTRYKYDRVDRLTEVIEADGASGGLGHDSPVTLTRYDAAGRVTEVIDPLKRRTEYKHDALGRRTETVIHAPDKTVLSQSRMSYDAQDNLLSEDSGNAKGRPGDYAHHVVTRYLYDGFNRRTAVIEAAEVKAAWLRPLHLTTWTDYDAGGNVIRVLSPEAVLTEHTYDPLGQRTATVEAKDTAVSRTTSYAYDKAGRLEEVTAPAVPLEVNGQTVVVAPKTFYHRDDLGRVTLTAEAWNTSAQRSVSTAYDADDRVTQQQDAVGVWTRTGYDPLGRVTAVTEAEGTAVQRTTHSAYDAADNLRWQVRPVQYDAFFDAFPSPLPQDVPETRYGYDALNRRTSVTEAANVPTAELGHAPPRSETRYDAAGRVVEELGPVVEVGLELLGGALHWRTVTAYEYDHLDRRREVWEGDLFDGVLTPSRRWLRQAKLDYDGAGNLVGQTTGLAPAGSPFQAHVARTTHEYDAANRRVRMYEGLDEQGQGNHEAGSRWAEWDYDEVGNTLQERRSRHNVGGGPVPYNKDNIHWVTVTRSQYDELNRRTAVTEAYAKDELKELNEKLLGPPGKPQASPHTTYKYDAADRVTQTLNPRGVGTGFYYDALGRQTKVVEAEVVPNEIPSPSAGKPTSQRQYDAEGRLTRSIDAAKAATAYHLDGLGWVTKAVEAEGRKEQRTTWQRYDAAGRLTRQTQSLVAAGPLDLTTLELTTGYSYDALGRQVEVKALADMSDAQVFAAVKHVRPVTKLRYDALGRAVQVDERIGGAEGGAPAGWRRTRTAYDALGRPVRVFEDGDNAPGSRLRKARYDAAGNRTWESDARGVETHYGHDRLNRVTRITQRPDEDDELPDLVTTLAYSHADQVVIRTTPVGRTKYAYDRLGRLRYTIEDNDHEVHQHYDPAGNLVALIDNGKAKSLTSTTGYAYDALNRRIEETDPRNRKATARYDALGRETWRKNRRGQVIKTEYDNLGRLSKESWQKSEGGEEQYRRELEYNLFDGLARSSVPLNKAQAHLLAGEADPDKKALKHVLKYDALGRLRLDASMGLVQALAYDAGGRLVRVTDTLGGAEELSYDAAGRVTRRWLRPRPDGLHQESAPREVTLDWSYQEGADGTQADLVKTVERRVGGVDGVSTVSYGSDSLGRPRWLEAKAPGAAKAQEWLSYSYNKAGLVEKVERSVGQRNGRQPEPYSEYVTTTEYDAIGQVRLETYEHKPFNGRWGEEVPSYQPRFDAQGNREKDKDHDFERGNQLVKDKRASYEYDWDGGLTKEKLRSGAGEGTYVYDTQGRLVRAEVPAGLAEPGLHAGAVDYLYDAEGRLVRRQEGASATDVHYQGRVRIAERQEGSHVRYLRGAGADDLQGNQLRDDRVLVRWTITDYQGSVLREVSHDGAISHRVVRYRGGATVPGCVCGGAGDTHRYAGRPVDPVTGLRHHDARWLNERTGRWMSEDPIGFAGGDSNLYRYVANSWPNATDPSGLLGWGWVAAGLGAALGAAVYTVGAGVNTLITGENQFTLGGLAGAAAGGAVAGLIVGALTGDATSVAGLAGIGMLAGAGGGFVGSFTTSVIDRGASNFDLWESTKEGLIGAAAGAVGGLLGGGVGGALARSAGGQVAGMVFGGVIGGAGGGATGGALTAWSRGEDIQAGALHGGIQGALLGGAGGVAASRVPNSWWQAGMRVQSPLATPSSTPVPPSSPAPPRTVRTARGETQYPDGATLKNWKGEDVKIPTNHIMSLRDPDMEAPPILRRGPFTDAQKEGFAQGNDGDTFVTPHHRHQLPIRDGGVFDELPRAGHPEGNVHLGGSPTRHPNDGRNGRNKSLFSGKAGKKLHADEIDQFFRDKASRLIFGSDGLWYDPGYK